MFSDLDRTATKVAALSYPYSLSIARRRYRLFSSIERAYEHILAVYQDPIKAGMKINRHICRCTRGQLPLPRPLQTNRSGYQPPPLTIPPLRSQETLNPHSHYQEKNCPTGRSLCHPQLNSLMHSIPGKKLLWCRGVSASCRHSRNLPFGQRRRRHICQPPQVGDDAMQYCALHCMLTLPPVGSYHISC